MGPQRGELRVQGWGVQAVILHRAAGPSHGQIFECYRQRKGSHGDAWGTMFLAGPRDQEPVAKYVREASRDGLGSGGGA